MEVGRRCDCWSSNTEQNDTDDESLRVSSQGGEEKRGSRCGRECRPSSAISLKCSSHHITLLTRTSAASTHSI